MYLYHEKEDKDKELDVLHIVSSKRDFGYYKDDTNECKKFRFPVDE